MTEKGTCEPIHVRTRRGRKKTLAVKRGSTGWDVGEKESGKKEAGQMEGKRRNQGMGQRHAVGALPFHDEKRAFAAPSTILNKQRKYVQESGGRQVA